jgi:hypothetical protein
VVGNLKSYSRIAMFVDVEEFIPIAWTLLYGLGHAVPARNFECFIVTAHISKHFCIHKYYNSWNT